MEHQRKELVAPVRQRLMISLAARTEWHKTLLCQFAKGPCYTWGRGQMAKRQVALVHCAGISTVSQITPRLHLKRFVMLSFNPDSCCKS